MSSDSMGQFSNPSPGVPEVPAAPQGDGRPVQRPEGVGAYRFAVVSALRAAQLLRGCTPRVEGGGRRATVIAQLEVAGGHVAELVDNGAKVATEGRP